MIIVHSVELCALCPWVVISSLIKQLKNLHSAICTLPLVYAQEITTRLFHGFLQFVHFHWAFTARGLIPFTSRDHLLCLVVLRSNPPNSPHISLLVILVYTQPCSHHHLAGTKLIYHLLGQAVPILSSCWHKFILGYLSKNRCLIWFRWHIKPENYQ
jgi:hypothetical protein